MLFDGKDLSQWDGGDDWIVHDGYAVADKTDISTKQSFGDCQLHVEWAAPEKVVGSGQGRGNSGVFMMDRYEIQILDSYNNDTYYDGQCGAVYKQHPPMVNVCRKPGEWQTYDIIFDAPRFNDDGKLLQPAYVTVLHNGVLVQNHYELLGSTSYIQAPVYTPHPARAPVTLQYHGNPVRFRNIWIREIPPMEPLSVPAKPPAAKPQNLKPEKAACEKPKAEKPWCEKAKPEKPAAATHSHQAFARLDSPQL